MSLFNLPTGKNNNYIDKKWPLDWVASWFPILREYGEYTDIVFVKMGNEAQIQQTYFLDHGVYDGVGGFTYLLEKEHGAGVEHKVTPVSSPGIFAKLCGFISYLMDSRVNHVAWRKRNFDVNGAKQTPSVLLISVDECKKILQKCKDQNATLTAYFALTLDKLVRQEFISTGKVEQNNLWLVPVNMRGIVEREESYSNQASYVCLKINGEDDKKSVTRKLKTQLAHGYHLASWWGILIGQKVGLKGMKNIMRRYYKHQHSWAGTISNLGVWNLPKAQGHWTFCPPVTKAHPVALGMITFNGGLGLALQIHPSLSISKEGVGHILLKFKEKISAPG